MRKETLKIVEAFANGRAARAARTTTDGNAVYLHGNRIFWRDSEKPGTYYMCMCGWDTPTTRERLNGLLTYLRLPLYVFQKNHEQFVQQRHKADAEPLDPSEIFEITV